MVCSVSACGPCRALAKPKSITLGTGLPSCSVTRMLVGLMSRWIIPFWWVCCTAWQTCTNRSSRADTGSRRSSQYCVSGIPPHQLHDEIGATIFGRTAVEHFGDIGMIHEHNAWRSAPNRVSTALDDMPGLISLRATMRRMGSRCSAIQTVPMPPSPITSSSRYRVPIVVPGAGPMPSRSFVPVRSAQPQLDWQNRGIDRTSRRGRRSAAVRHV